MKTFKVAVLANLKKNAPHWEGMPADQWDDLDSEKTVNALVNAIREGGHTCEFLEGDLSLPDTLRAYKPDICFNICEGHFGDAREAQVPSLLEMLQIPYTASKVLTLALCLDKPLTKRLLQYHGLPTPNFQVFETAEDAIDPDLTFPLFVKPSREGTGMGVSAQSIVRNEKELREQVKIINERYHQGALVEHFIEGREVTLGMMGNLSRPISHQSPLEGDPEEVYKGLHFFPPMEVDLDPYLETDAVYSNRLKVEIPEQINYLCPAPLEKDQLRQLQLMAGGVFHVTGALDVSRVDFRLDVHDHYKPYILEINPLPGLTPGISDIVMEANAEGMSHTELVLNILNHGLKRYGLM